MLRQYIVKIYIAKKRYLTTSKMNKFKTIMKNNQCTGNLAVMAKLTITTLTKFEQNQVDRQRNN